MKILFFLLSTIYLISCIDVPISSSSKDTFVYCIINPADSITILTLTKTFNVDKEIPIDSGKSVENALIEISGGSSKVKFYYNKASKQYKARTKDFFKSNLEYRLLIKDGNREYRSTTLIPEKHKIKINNVIIDGENVLIDCAWEKKDTIKTSFSIQGYVEVNQSTFLLYYWGSNQGVWRAASENFVSFNPPIGNFIFPLKYKVCNLNLILQSQNPLLAEFEKDRTALVNRTNFSKNFESPILFDFNIEGAYGIFSCYNEDKLKLAINR